MKKYITALNQRIEPKKLFRYLAVQVGSYAVDMGIFLLVLHFFQVNPIVAHLCGRSIAATLGFCLHRAFTFGIVGKEGRRNQALMFFLLVLINLPASAGLLSLLLLVIPVPAVAKFIADVIWVFANFWISKTFVFKTREQV